MNKENIATFERRIFLEIAGQLFCLNQVLVQREGKTWTMNSLHPQETSRLYVEEIKVAENLAVSKHILTPIKLQSRVTSSEPKKTKPENSQLGSDSREWQVSAGALGLDVSKPSFPMSKFWEVAKLPSRPMF